MKTRWFSLIALLGLFTLPSTLAKDPTQADPFQEPGLWHDVIPDSFAKNGTVYIQSRDLPEQAEFFQARFKYNFDYKFLFFNRNLQGEEVVDMPLSFQTENGFLRLEQEGTYDDPRVKLYHNGRVDWSPYYDCHLVRLVPKLSEKWEGEFVYCPDIPKSGIAEMRLTVKKIPFLGEHTITSLWRERPAESESFFAP